MHEEFEEAWHLHESGEIIVHVEEFVIGGCRDRELLELFAKPRLDALDGLRDDGRKIDRALLELDAPLGNA